MIIRHAVLPAVICIIMVLCAAARQADKPDRVVPMGYELYSWQQNGGWGFSVVPSPSGANVSAEEVFNKKFLLAGVKDLKRKISGLPRGATIFWVDRIGGPTQNMEDRKLSYPPPAAVQDIKKYAESHKMKVEILSDGQDQH
jgi:hypothetical protein